MKIKCPAHKDRTPSLHVYDDGAYCFVCGYRCSLGELGVDPKDVPKREPENIGETLEYIRTLPMEEIRGLRLHGDGFGYFIVWPDNSYYKKRLYEGAVRYVGPRGHRPPLLQIPAACGKHLVIVEGELNALSLGEVLSGRANICSPGSCTEALKHISLYLTTAYSFDIVVDKDIPGVAHGLKLKQELLKRGSREVKLVAVEKDINQILQDEGQEGVSKWAKEHLELPGGM